MLLLSRKCGERVLIDDGRIIVTVHGIYGREVKLGIEAPREVSIDREEVAERKRAGLCAPKARPEKRW